jgi:hypothetical protein
LGTREFSDFDFDPKKEATPGFMKTAITSWPEARALVAENSKAIAEWLFQDIICRWGCLREIITDNGKPFIAALKYLEEKYGIKGIRISAYNSKANGKVERPHWDLRQMLYKACNGDGKTSCTTSCGQTKLLCAKEWGARHSS